MKPSWVMSEGVKRANHMKKTLVNVPRKDNSLLYVFTENDRGKFQSVFTQFKHECYNVFIDYFGTKQPNEFKHLLDSCTDGRLSSNMGDVMERLDEISFTNFVFGLSQMNGLTSFDKMTLIQGNTGSLYVFSAILSR